MVTARASPGRGFGFPERYYGGVWIHQDFLGFAYFTPCSGRGFQFVGIHRGWTLVSFRTIAAGAGMLAALTLAATSSAPAEPAGTKPSATTHTRTAKPPHRVAKPQREARTRHGKRTRVARQRHRQSPEPVAQIARRPAASTRAESPTAVRPHTSAARRFREFLNPQSFAAVANEQLRSPRLLAAQFSGEIADPELVFANAATPVAAEPRAEAPPIIARDQTTGDDGPSKAPPLAHSDPVQVQRVAQSEKESDGMSFVRWFFVAWGGVLAFASAVRMAVG
jgi:hypothetical protein